jgi:hypothetical protein
MLIWLSAGGKPLSHSLFAPPIIALLEPRPVGRIAIQLVFPHSCHPLYRYFDGAISDFRSPGRMACLGQAEPFRAKPECPSCADNGPALRAPRMRSIRRE